MHVKEFEWECLGRGNWTRKGGLFSNVIGGGGKGRAGWRLCILPAGLRWSLSMLCFLNFLQAWDLNLPDPGGQGVAYMHPEGSSWACRGQMLLLGVGSIMHYFITWDRVSRWTWGLPDWPDWLAGKPQWCPWFGLIRIGIADLCHWGRLFMSMLEIQTQVFMVMCQTDITNWTVAPPLHELLTCVSCSAIVFLGFSGMD